MELVGLLDLGMSPSEAIASPRIHQQGSSDELPVELALAQNLKAALRQRGHKVVVLAWVDLSYFVARAPEGNALYWCCGRER